MRKKMEISCFNSSGIYGKRGKEITPDVVYRVSRAFGQLSKAKTIVVGSDNQISSEKLKASVCDGLRDASIEVLDIGAVSSEEVRFATRYYEADAGICVIGYHHPAYNGLKFLGIDSLEESAPELLRGVRLIAESGSFINPIGKGVCVNRSVLPDYISYLLSYIQLENLEPLKIVVNSNNVPASRVINQIEKRFKVRDIPVTFVKLENQDDEPLLTNNSGSLKDTLDATSDAIMEHEADFGIAWDHDFCRCFLFDESGRQIEGYYIVGLLAELFLKADADQKIISDPRAYWNTEAIVRRNGGIPVKSRVGDDYIRKNMRKENAIYGGDMASYHYFRDFDYGSSGMIPWLLIAELISSSGERLSALLMNRIDAHPISGEIHVNTKDRREAIQRVYEFYHYKASRIDKIDGLGMEFESYDAAWRFNIRASDFQPGLKLNVESEADSELVGRKITEISRILAGYTPVYAPVY
ncbi:phosphomannomutase CpsG [Vibrio sp. JC009]|uniref:phosphomannomutase CpsG n=1 Tax=Vibrio sp. JC009 TaxID=2912314 RepID=UPI0023AF2CFA|nr:phosphomannomutase CpsG [Vibrio sp. JC009]WED20602.1 phosphomannomutase CpsG [Vibrio sp. JC009]